MSKIQQLVQNLVLLHACVIKISFECMLSILYQIYDAANGHTKNNNVHAPHKTPNLEVNFTFERCFKFEYGILSCIA